MRRSPAGVRPAEFLVRAPRRISGDLVTGLPSAAKRIHVVVLKNPTS
jgi:hypothetical protein